MAVFAAVAVSGEAARSDLACRPADSMFAGVVGPSHAGEEMAEQ